MKPSLEERKRNFINNAIAKFGKRFSYNKVNYKGSAVKVEIYCNKHKEYFWQRPNTHLTGKGGCPQCTTEERLERAKNNVLSNDEFIKRAIKVHRNDYDYSLVEYKTAKTKIKIKCKKHNCVFEQIPSNHLSGSGCPVCAEEKIQKAKFDDKKSFVEKAIKVHGDTYNYGEVIYRGSKENIKIICKAHGCFLQTPSNHLQGKGCPKCGGEKANEEKRYTTSYFIKESNKIHNGFYNYDNSIYTSFNDRIDIECPIHGVFSAHAGFHMNRGTGCPECGKEKSALSRTSNTEEFVEKALKRHNGFYKYSKVDYKNINLPVIITCPKHGDFKQKPSHHLQGKGCTKCRSNKSKLERELYETILNHIKAESSNKKILDGYEIDIYVPEKKIGIEFDGLYFHSDAFVDKYYHVDKTKLAKEKGVTLIHVFEDEWRYKKSIVKSRLLNILGKTPNRIYGRNCEIKEVSSKDTTKFLNENHLQGTAGAKVRIGLYYNDELVSLMTFGGLRINLGQKRTDGHYELTRFCNKINTNVIGGASKLFKYFVDNYSPKQIISYADYRWSNGDMYEKLGFDFVKLTPPNYFYMKGRNRENRFKYRKSELVRMGHDKDKTEKQIMEELGYKRIYDCGALKYVYTPKVK